jgi:hypothetical protein
MFAFSFDGLIFWMLFAFWLFAMGIGQVCSGIWNTSKKVLENETTQEVGKGLLHSWLESVVGKR